METLERKPYDIAQNSFDISQEKWRRALEQESPAEYQTVMGERDYGL